MTKLNGSSASADYVFLYTEDLTWMNAFTDSLRHKAYPFRQVLERDALTGWQPGGLSVLIVAGDCYNHDFVLKLRTANPYALFINILTNPRRAMPADDELFDSTISQNDSNCVEQVLSLLRLHEKNRQLLDKINGLQGQIEQQHRSSDEIEVLKNAIVRNVSHELRTPLLQVKSAVSLIAEDVSDQKLVSFAENAMARLETLVKNITMYGQSLDIRLGPIILRDSVEYARRNLGRIWERRSEADRIQLKIADRLPPVLADKQGLSTVMQLLMDNALKFSGKEQPIEVIGCLREDHIYIAVRDYGIGIAPDKIQDIFESFYQIDYSTTRRYGGMGIGLALVKLILEHHNTQINVDSELGKGSTFWFLLPCVNLDRHELEG